MQTFWLHRLPRSCCRARRSGSATLEFAVLMPLLITLMLLCVDFGRFAHAHIAVTNAARVGAAYASVHPVTNATLTVWQANVRAAAAEELAANSWYVAADLNVPLAESITEGNGTRRVQVEVTYPFRTIINWPFLPGYNTALTLRRTVVMRTVR